MGKFSDLAGRVVVVTGAASGIGRATALAFARAGARVHLVDIDGAGLSRVTDEMAGLGHRGMAHVLDCSRCEDMDRLADEVYEMEGRTDVLHNNAGVCLGGAAGELTMEDWRWITDVNYWGVVNGIHAFLPRMIGQGGNAHIVNTASMAGLVGLPYVAPYCATKFAVVGLSEALSAELAIHDIRVTAICTGMVRTNVGKSARLTLPGSWGEKFTASFDRWGADPDRVARRIVKAVRRGESFVVMGGEMAPLWWVRRVSVKLYQWMARVMTRQAIERRGG